MHDPDAVMAYEAKQQRVVDEIIFSLHQKTSDCDNYVEIFRQLAVDILLHLSATKSTRIATHSSNLLQESVFPPINVFTSGQEDSAEWHLLLVLVLDKVLVSVKAEAVRNYWPARFDGSSQ